MPDDETDTSMLREALAQAGDMNRQLLARLADMEAVVERTTNEAWSWRQRWTTANDRLQDMYPQPRGTEIDLERQLRAANNEIEDWKQKYAGSFRAPTETARTT